MILQRVHSQDRPTVKMALDAAAIGTGIDFECRLQFADRRITLHQNAAIEAESVTDRPAKSCCKLYLEAEEWVSG
jgi:hypothetical protein